MQNLDGAKFCRACGTNLETVALALAQKLHPAHSDKQAAKNSQAGKNKLEKRSEGLTKIVRASGLIGASALIGAMLALFSNQPDWILIWMIFAGWMACWGIMWLVSGFAALIESGFTPLRQGTQQRKLSLGLRHCGRETIRKYCLRIRFPSYHFHRASPNTPQNC